MKFLLVLLFCVGSLAIPFTKTSIAQESQTLKKLVAKVNPSVVTIRVNGRDGERLGVGTGFIVDSAGLIATNFSVETSGGEKLKVIAVEASDPTADLALIRVAVDDKTSLPALPFSDQDDATQGTRVAAFGNPLGLSNSVVDGIISALREVQGQQLIQLAMPIEPGNSGGPLVDRRGRVLGIINMKSAVDDNLGFAIPIKQLKSLLDSPNPVSIDRWVRLGKLNPDQWQPLMGSTWQQRGGVLTARGLGSGFGGRSLCLSKQTLPALPVEIAVSVKLDDESGAAGIAFYSDGKNKHYGFYPSNGQMRLTCFKGPDVYSWQVLQDVATPHYLPGQWNRLRVRLEDKLLKCYVNDQLVITSNDCQLASGSIGLVKFRGTNPDFRRLEVGSDLESAPLTDTTEQLLNKVDQGQLQFSEIDDSQLGEFGQTGEASARELMKRAARMEKEASSLRQLADEVRRVEVVEKLRVLFSTKEVSPERLLTGTLLAAQLDNPDIDLGYYRQRIEAMAKEVNDGLSEDADDASKLIALNDFLFQENGFHGGRSEYYHPANSHLNRVIDDREGLPITLSILYMEIGRRIGLNILGVGLPGHFVVRHEPSDDADEHQLIDVYEGGSFLTLNEAGTRVMQRTGRRLSDEDLRSQSDQEIVTRVLSNLMGIASRKEDIESMLCYLDASVAVNPNAIDFRVMRAQLRGMTGRRTRALADVDFLLDSNTPGIDRRRLQQLRSTIADQN